MYSFYLNGVLLPVAPGAVKIKIKNKNETLSLIDYSEVNILRKPGLSDISFTVMLPMQQGYPFAIYPDGFHAPDYYLSLLESVKLDTDKPLRLIISRVTPGGQLLFDTSMDVSLEEYEMTEEADKGFDVYVDIKLKAYKSFGTKTITVASTQPSASAREAISAQPAVQTVQQRQTDKETLKSYTVKPGDTLWAICQKQLGNGSKFADIAKLNGIANPNVIRAGQVIRFG